MLRAIFFDAAGTLIYLPRSVGEHYREVAADFGALLDAGALNAAFRLAWTAAPPRPSDHQPRADDDKGWWQTLVHQVLGSVLTAEEAERFDEAGYFAAVYAHFTKTGVWQAFDDVHPALQSLRARGLTLGVISNFDRRLYTILEGLGLSGYFDAITISSEVGADKPDPMIFQQALAQLHVEASEAMHVGDEPKKDGGAETAGMAIFHLERPVKGLSTLCERLAAVVPS